MPKRLSCILADDVADALTSLAERRGVTVTEAVRHAIGTQHFLDIEQAAGAKVLLERDGDMREVVWRG